MKTASGWSILLRPDVFLLMNAPRCDMMEEKGGGKK